MVYFIRHGESEANVLGIHAGPRINSPLTKKGILQARQAAKKARESHVKIDCIVSSPIGRAYETAQIFAKELGVKIKVDNRLSEYDMGLAAGESITETDNIFKVSNEKAEPVDQFEDRVMEAVKHAEAMTGNVLIVSHAGVARIIKWHHLSEDQRPQTFIDLQIIGNCELHQLKDLLN